MLLSRVTPISNYHDWFHECAPDLQVVDCHGGGRLVHKLVLSILSNVLESILLDCEEEAVVILPDVLPSTLDNMLRLAYQGFVGGLEQISVDNIRELIGAINLSPEQLVVEPDVNCSRCTIVNT